MQDPRNHVPSSPTISSVSSSDLDTESTGSFFHDRSITLGTLIGFSFTATMPMPFRASSHRHVSPSVAISRASSSNARRLHQRKRPPSSNSAEPERHRRRKWWRFCRDDDDDAGIHRGTGDSKRSSLGEYLEVERRFGDEAVYNAAEAAELEGAVARYQDQQPVMGERALFADGRVLPPASAEMVTGEGTPVATALCRFPVSLTGICSGGGG
ncbi:PREDICTED: uncharacterized protein At3g17950 isoform X1 [Camelina sativa]|uniref:Uncharacterized protein At3g17950 isoform X1 n=1 Tax=Camelina sativa TaxID=90675 RepID=A0ABM0YUT8_CAMSA|nr:PREDICTED: uncharacterized protein At3g17950 isoform X1 [Camelina sativa]